jgi:hypothetical protein
MVPENLALGLDPKGGNRFPIREMRKIKNQKRESPGAHPELFLIRSIES